jgi:aminoglycoside 3-N-acetyltransferase
MQSSIESTLKGYAKAILHHRRDFYINILINRVSHKSLTKLFQNLGLKKGDCVFVHCAFSRLGYFPGGPHGLIRLLQGVVGPKGTIAMPAFPFSGSMQDFLAKPYYFDINETPSKVGFLSEAFRTYPGVYRSLHPTHSICAIGKNAMELVADHELSVTPCGTQSPFAKFSTINAVLLRIGTGALTLYHHIQELIDYPNLFLPKQVTIRCKDPFGKEISVRTSVYRKKIPNILFLGYDTSDQLLSVHPRDFPLLYSGDREELLKSDPMRQLVLNKLRELRAFFVQNGILRIGEINGCKCELFLIKKFIDYAVSEEMKLIRRFKKKYALQLLTSLLEKGAYPK